ncbi:MAG: NUDIX domain-containing protein [Acidimicrobiales bacterium]
MPPGSDVCPAPPGPSDLPFAPRGPLPQAEYEAIYARVPRLTVEVVIASEAGVLLTRREAGPCRGLWHIPGGTVRFGEPLAAAVARVAQDELGLEATAGALLGYIEYPSHLERGLDWPVGMAFRTVLATSSAGQPLARPEVAGWFCRLPDEMHDEQRAFLRAHGLAT